MKTSIDIDIDVYRRIESSRVTFSETPNDILRRILGIDQDKPRRISEEPRARPSRSSGAWSTVFGSDPIEANTLKALLRKAILIAEKSSPGLRGVLAAQPTRRGRHIVAATPEGLYPQSPHLAEFAEELSDGWWFDGNVSRNQTQSYLSTIARIARLPPVPPLRKRSEKTTDDLEL